MDNETAINLDKEIQAANVELETARAMPCVCATYLKNIGDCCCNRNKYIRSAKNHLELLINSTME